MRASLARRPTDAAYFARNYIDDGPSARVALVGGRRSASRKRTAGRGSKILSPGTEHGGPWTCRRAGGNRFAIREGSRRSKREDAGGSLPDLLHQLRRPVTDDILPAET